MSDKYGEIIEGQVEEENLELNNVTLDFKNNQPFTIPTSIRIDKKYDEELNIFEKQYNVDKLKNRLYERLHMINPIQEPLISGRILPEDDNNHEEIDLKDFSDKLPMEDIKPICLRAISEVMRYGRRKYGSEPDQKCSYENGEIDSYVGALLRHLNEYQYGNYTDSESELPHLWHVLMNAYIITVLDEKKSNEQKD